MSRRRNAGDDERGSTYGDIVIQDSANAHLGNAYHSHVVENLHVYLSEPPLAISSDPSIHPSGLTTLSRWLGFSRDGPLLEAEASLASQSVPGAVIREDLRESGSEVRSVLLFLLSNASRVNVSPARLTAVLWKVLMQMNRAGARTESTISLGPLLSAQVGGDRSSHRVHGLHQLPAKRHREHNNRKQAVRDFFTCCALFLSFFVYRRASSAELLATISKLHATLLRVRDDKISTCLAVLLTVFVYRLLQQASSQKSISEFPGDCILFEDVFSNLRSVPLCYFQGSHIFEGFLREHYRGSIAEYFIDHGLYNITFGRRDGPTFEHTDIVDGWRLKANVRIIMAIFWGAVVRRCPDCQSVLRISVGDSVTW